jgi:hypothetical protein
MGSRKTFLSKGVRHALSWGRQTKAPFAGVFSLARVSQSPEEGWCDHRALSVGREGKTALPPFKAGATDPVAHQCRRQTAEVSSWPTGAILLRQPQVFLAWLAMR